MLSSTQKAHALSQDVRFFALCLFLKKPYQPMSSRNQGVSSSAMRAWRSLEG